MDSPKRLSCEHAINPTALETRRPRLSWIPESRLRGEAQTAYRIICSADKGTVERGRGDLWDSGKVRSAENHLVAWGGPDLDECSAYFWAVRTWGEVRGAAAEGKETESPWSEAASMETAVLDQASWKASWISMEDPAFEETSVLLVKDTINNNVHVPSKLYQAIYLRHEFDLKEAPVRARAYVCGLGYYEAYANGTRLGDHRLDPGQTDYSRKALYSTYNAEGLLRKGRNALGIILGNGRYLDAYGFGEPRAFLQLLCEFSDGSRTLIVTGPSWTCSHGPILHNGIYSGETCDARLEQEGWAGPGFTGSGWKNVVVVEGPKLESQTLPPIRATVTLPARDLANPAPGVYVFDFGQNFSGVVRLRLRGPRGTPVTLQFAELLGPDGRLNLGTNRESRSRDRYILSGKGEETFEPRFTYHGFRYAEVTGFPGVPGLDSAEGVVIHTDVRTAGTFVCADPLVNKIHRNILWGQLSNLMSAPTDCPQRGERMGWLGDAQLASEEACCNFDMAGFYVKYLEDIRLAQRSDGSLSDVVPPYWPLYPADPAWGAAYVTLALTMYEQYGDPDILDRHYEGMKRYVDFLESSAEDHILKSLGRYGDWCPPGTIYPKKTPMEFTSTWYLYFDTLRFSRIAAALGRKTDAEEYASRAEEVARAFNDAFLLGEGRYTTFRMSPIDRSVGQTTQTLPLFLDLVPPDQRERAVIHLMKAVATDADCHVDTGIVGARYLFEVLRDAGHAETAWKVITQTSYPGWGYMVAEGATSLWERWEKLGSMGMNSHNHIMFGSVDAWFYRTLGGIIPLEPLWQLISIAPYAVGALTHAAVSQETIRGTVAVSWSRSGSLAQPGAADAADAADASETSGRGPGEFRLSVTVPSGTRAKLRLPFATLARELSEGGIPLWSSGNSAALAGSSPGVGPISRIDQAFMIDLDSGTYEFLLRC